MNEAVFYIYWKISCLMQRNYVMNFMIDLAVKPSQDNYIIEFGGASCIKK